MISMLLSKFSLQRSDFCDFGPKSAKMGVSSVADCGLRFARIGVGFRCIFFFQSTDPTNAGACVAWGAECNEANTGKAVLEGERGALA